MYCTLDDLISLFGESELVELTSRDQMSIIDEDKINRVIEQACDEIDGYIAIKVKLPFDDGAVPRIINRIACNISRYRLYDDRVIDEVEKRYKDELTLLREIRDGKFLLSVPTIDELGNIDNSTVPQSNIEIQNVNIAFDDSFFN